MTTIMIILIGLLFMLAVLLVIDDHEKYGKYADMAVQTGKCPYCDERMLRYEYYDKDGKQLVLWCPDCEFDVKRTVEDDTRRI